ncbi:MIP/aquaporin family protein [Kushneria indalinina]|uniref:Glycerol uptake facilitator protein n=1 Tax=Kushneria indalinina DSM 14324 TaxID=1122140 RepID=A0A3D9E1J2_9GAMM|nr:MIP/aquaporin family protein [Kushneria indalinina]REC96399.1 glycerol uptake facilitator protein [Kushneria indalinina DSM 14324]
MGVIETILVHEIAGTAFLTLLGCGVVANVLLKKTNGHGSDGIVIFFGWGLAVFCAVYVAFDTGAHINPAVTVALLIGPAKEYAEGIPITFATTVAYLVAEFIGAFIGAIACYLAYKKQYDDMDDAGAILATFSTGPAIKSYGWNMVTEIIGTFVLIFVIIMFGNTPSGLGPLAVALLVVSIGASLGGPTGYAINPARDLGPRIAHAVLPIKNKGSNNWGYALVPVIGPIIGSTLAALAAHIY